MDKKIKKIGLLTSGGDAPGMNAAIRAVVRAAIGEGWTVVGFSHGYEGILKLQYQILDDSTISNILQKGGTILKTARSLAFRNEESQKDAAVICRRLGLDALIVIGGDGSFKGAAALAKFGINVIGIPATIDLDVASTDYTIGIDTACNTAINAIDHLRDTSEATDRCFVIKIMGNKCGLLALHVALASGADYCLIPEKHPKVDVENVVKHLIHRREGGKNFHLVIVAEGCLDKNDKHSLNELGDEIAEKSGIETRVYDTGHILRGGCPTCVDRVNSTKLGSYAISILKQGVTNSVVAYQNERLVNYNIEDAINMKKSFDDILYQSFIKMAKIDEWCHKKLFNIWTVFFIYF